MSEISSTRANEIMEAHQFLYYVKNSPIWSDYEYDLFCKKHGLNSIGGSDREEDYSDDVIELAEEMQNNPDIFSYGLYK